MPLCNRLLLCSYGNFPSLAHPLLSTQRLLFIFHPKLSMAYSEGDGVRSVGQTDSEQKGRFVESPFLGFPIHLVHKGAKGVNGFTSAVLASAQLGTGLRPPFCLMDRNRVSLEPGLTPALASIVAWTSVDARQPSAPSSMPWRSTSMVRCPLLKKEAVIKPQKKASLSLQGQRLGETQTLRLLRRLLQCAQRYASHFCQSKITV